MNDNGGGGSASWVRTRVPTEVHAKAAFIADHLGLTIPNVYTFILTRELWDADPVEYTKILALQAKLQLVKPLQEN